MGDSRIPASYRSRSDPVRIQQQCEVQAQGWRYHSPCDLGHCQRLCGILSKDVHNSGSTTSASVYNFYTYVFSAIVLVLFFLFSKGKSEDKFDAKALFGKVFWFVGIMAVCLFACSYFNTLAAKHLGAAQLYPLTQGAGLILSTIMSAVFFGEKIKPRLIVGVSAAFVGLLAINLFPMLFGN